MNDGKEASLDEIVVIVDMDVQRDMEKEELASNMERKGTCNDSQQECKADFSSKPTPV